MSRRPSPPRFVVKSIREHVQSRKHVYIGEYLKILRYSYMFGDGSVPYFIFGETHSSPGLDHLFKEVINNATDNVDRSRNAGVNPKRIEVTLQPDGITVKNYGMGIPVGKQKYPVNGANGRTEMVEDWITGVIFGVMFSSSNYDDDMRSTTAGVNGMGVKLVNFLSTKFVVDHVDDKGNRLTITWMGEKRDVKTYATKAKPGNGYTSVTYMPDLAQFGEDPKDGIPADTIAICKALAIGACASVDIPCVINGKTFKFSTFERFTQDCYFGDVKRRDLMQISGKSQRGNTYTYDAVVSGIHVGPNVSYINSIMVPEGVHLNAIMSQITAYINEVSPIKLTNEMIAQHITVIVRATVDRPQFSTQSKTNYRSPAWTIQPLDTTNKNKIRGWEAYTSIEEMGRNKVKQDLEKNMTVTKGESLGVPKAVDAIYVRDPKYLERRTLIICEGDSSSNYVGRWRPKYRDPNDPKINGEHLFGYLPITGKPRNVYTMTPASIFSELKYDGKSTKPYGLLARMMGLPAPTIDNFDADMDQSRLRYWNILIMADADVDGKHIVSLIFAFFYRLYPQIVREGRIYYYRLPMIRVFNTPITNNENARAVISGIPPARTARSRAANSGTPVLMFTAAHDFARFNEVVHIDSPNRNIKYFKGLSSSSVEDIDADAKIFEYMIVRMTADREMHDQLIKMFDNKFADYRKEWLMENFYNMIEPYPVDLTYFNRFITSAPINNHLDFEKYINGELIQYSLVSNVRAIASMMDGFKDCQRKVFYNMTVVNPMSSSSSKKVTELGMQTAGVTKYQHGETSLSKAILVMTHDFVGASNMPVIRCMSTPASRRDNGAGMSSPRYVSVSPPTWLGLVFRKEDAIFICENRIEEGEKIEFREFYPIIPMAMVNGTDGIGTGWSTGMPTFNPLMIIAWLISYMQGEVHSIAPWYRNFYGYVEENPNGGFRSFGRYATKKTRGNIGDIIIHDIPIGTTFESYEAFLAGLRDAKLIRDFTVMTDQALPHLEKQIFILKGADLSVLNTPESLKLVANISVNNMTVLRYNEETDNYIPHIYRDPVDFLTDFYQIRLNLYELYRVRKVDQMTADIYTLQRRRQYIELQITGVISIVNSTRADITAAYVDHGFTVEEIDTFIRMPQYMLTNDEINRLDQKIADDLEYLNYYQTTSAANLWAVDLRTLYAEIATDSSYTDNDPWSTYRKKYGIWPKNV